MLGTRNDTRLAAAIMLALFCVVPPSAAEAGAVERALPAISRGCAEHVGLFLIERTVVRPWLPEGFAPAYFPADVANLDPAGRSAEILTVTIRCETVQWDDGSRSEGSSSALLALVVEPPTALARAGADFHAIGLRSFFRRGSVTFGETAANLLRAAADDVADGSRRLRLTTGAGDEIAAMESHWRLFATRRRVIDAIDVDSTSASGTQPGVAHLATEGVGLPAALEGIGVHQWGFDTTMEHVRSFARPRRERT